MRLPSVIAEHLPVSRGEVDRLTKQLGAERNNVELLAEQLDEQRSGELVAESVGDLERGLFEPGWLRMTALAEQEFTAEGRTQMHAICRLYGLKNPLIKRGLALRAAYVFGQGVEITARANGKRDGEQDVQAVISAFLDDAANKRAVTGPGAQDRLEHELGTGGNVFVALFTRPLTGVVQARVIPTDEVADVISNPDDAAEPWFYHRRWNQRIVDEFSGTVRTEVREQLYPCVDYRPLRRPSKFGGKRVAWDSPVLHIDVNRPEGWMFGVPDAYAAVDWAKAYKEFLEDWARLMRALSRYAWKATTPGNKAAAVRARIAASPTRDAGTGEPNAAGATALLSPDVALEAINKSGATIDAESGRPLAMMVASALDVPVTMLLADPGQTGARATAETLDQPTELAMTQRRNLWAAAYQRMLLYVIAESVRAPGGALKGRIVVDGFGREHVELAGDTDATIDIVWPDLDDTDPATLVEAIAKAAATGTVPPEVILRLLLTALGVRNTDEIVEQLLDDDGNFVWPGPPPLGQGSDAAGAERDGRDPADMGPGSMAPDDEPDEGEPEE